MPHLWWGLGTVGPLTRSVADSALVYDVLRGNVPGDRFRAADPVTSFAEAAAREPGRLRIGWSTKAVAIGVRPDPQHVHAVAATAALLHDLGHDVREVDPAYPEPTAAFVPQFFAGVRSEVEIVERPELLERRTRQTARMGSWVRPAVVEWAIRQGEKVAAQANRVFDTVDVLLTPTIAHRPPEVGVLDGTGTVRAALRSMPMIAYAALWNVAGNPAANVPVGIGSDGLPLGVQLVGRPHDETTLLSLSAQLERVQPWADRRPAL